ncbi:ABC transporter permease [Paenibacillus apiarius]|uniref:ABC transporter permease n=1 Tax=Paenibacillus apiarius TaxID=46240 RepID=A0ABT4DVW9_9BACL|nr:ABC transporter permease [Paenibacillus apiarius]MCY9513251.1 ABC transporter permease [Paenibacillus apiarius]MCY9521390.1 ABC transporter permease [Paenibacillus apiarius]MCY9554464.1 ABC transporter permease [Paenibacillus apiarius]MCY9560667.1 ABC transporter permease [Paenibacillus apiarius]MCY9685082.1 ABC transporter permease [Paenibacillus apiarius]
MSRYRRLRIGAAVFVLFACAFAYVLAPHDPHLVDIGKRLLPPSPEYPFGTDSMGRCVLSRVLYGGRTTLGIVLLTWLTTLAAGMPIGIAAGLWRGRWRWLGDSFLNVLASFPPIVYLIVWIGAWGSGMHTVVVALTIASLVSLVKLVKAKAEIERDKAYVYCAAASGASKLRIMFWHLPPNLIRESVVLLSLISSDMVLMISGFSFIGLGLEQNGIDWGAIMMDGRAVAMLRPDIMLYPLAFIFLCAYSFNVLGEELE